MTKLIERVITACIYAFLLNVGSYYIAGLKSVKISIPEIAEGDENVRLTCDYNLENETLYSLKWFKEEREFYRFSPREIPPIKIFKVPQLEVVQDESKGGQVTLKKAAKSMFGRYSCEVSTDAPWFNTMIASGELQVKVVPKETPYSNIKVDTPKVKEGDWANLTCISNGSIPATNLIWTVNDKPVPGNLRIIHSQKVLDKKGLTETSSSISFQVDETYFKENSSLKVRCIVSTDTIYQKTYEIDVLLDKPNENSSGAAN